MSDLPVYPVTVTREDGLWVAVVDGLAGGATDVDRFDELHDAVLDLISTLTDLDPGEFWIQWQFLQGSYQLFEMLRDLRQWEKQADFAVSSRDAARRQLAGELRGAGLSLREIADVIGTSHQRIAQILDKAPAKDILDPRLSDLVAQAGDQAPARLASTVAQLTRLADASEPTSVEFDYPRPLLGAFVFYLDAALHVAPGPRHDLFTTTASFLDDVAEDPALRHVPHSA